MSQSSSQLDTHASAGEQAGEPGLPPIEARGGQRGRFGAPSVLVDQRPRGAGPLGYQRMEAAGSGGVGPE